MINKTSICESKNCTNNKNGECQGKKAVGCLSFMDILKMGVGCLIYEIILFVARAVSRNILSTHGSKTIIYGITSLVNENSNFYRFVQIVPVGIGLIIIWNIIKKFAYKKDKISNIE